MLDYTQLEALLAVDEIGTFEGAARKLNLSSFAVVQRIKALETKLGVILIKRSPTRTSEVGKVLCDHTRQVRELETDAMAAHRQESMEPAETSQIIPIAINDETLSEWFLGVLDILEETLKNINLEVVLFPHQQTSEKMQSGEIVAALTSQKKAVYGFKSYTLGKIEYRAVASPAFISAYFLNDMTPTNLAKAPALRFCVNDDLIHDWINSAFGKIGKNTVYTHPSSYGSLTACLEGQVWGMYPYSSVSDYLKEGSLVELIPNTPVTRTHYWQVVGNMIDTLKPITNVLRQQEVGSLL